MNGDVFLKNKEKKKQVPMSVQESGAWVCVILIQVSILCLLGVSLPGGITISVVPLKLGCSSGMRWKRVV